MTDRRPGGNPLWAVYETIAMVIGLGTLALICLGWLPFALLLRPLLPRRRAQAIGRARVRQLRSQVFVFSRANFQKCHYNSANCSGAAGFPIHSA